MSVTTHESSRRLEYLGEPTLGQVMRRPRWILALLLALLVAAVFAWLGQWQMDNAIRSDAQQEVDTETPRLLAEVDEAGSGVTDAAAGMVVLVSGALVPGDTRIVTPRENAGEMGAWVVGHLAVAAEPGGEDTGVGLAVAIGWAPSVEQAEAAAARFEADPAFADLRDLEGRFMPPEGPVIPKAGEDPQVMHAMVPAQLVNSWQPVEGPVHSGYLVVHPTGGGAEMLAGAGLDAIDSVPPEPAESVSWLNVFYAIEWIVFAGFAIFLWYRLARDAWEKEHELQKLTAAEGGRSAVGGQSDALL
ncbi:SURF1 family cytochrome oxidase biogenesis protein [Leucobacter celer]|uniref:SURF1 family cytochrome oxidase biogenesis protein n=1 Tax=Leucobacter celer TaxID=668625 RepID=UPI000A5009A6|nr:SURF1 family cytochrome oxidase biogenesis protein [Leucobacter celer]